MKTIGVVLTLLFLTGLKTEGQWSEVDSGTTNGGRASGLELVAANSLKGGFAVDLPLTGKPGIECRSGGSKANFTVNFIFNKSPHLGRQRHGFLRKGESLCDLSR